MQWLPRPIPRGSAAPISSFSLWFVGTVRGPCVCSVFCVMLSICSRVQTPQKKKKRGKQDPSVTYISCSASVFVSIHLFIRHPYHGAFEAFNVQKRASFKPLLTKTKINLPPTFRKPNRKIGCLAVYTHGVPPLFLRVCVLFVGRVRVPRMQFILL